MRIKYHKIRNVKIIVIDSKDESITLKQLKNHQSKETI